jgi:hypothetical protein
MKLPSITILSACAISILPIRAEIQAENLKFYRPLMSDLSGAALDKLLQSIDTPLPHDPLIEINRRIGCREFLNILEKKVKGRPTADGAILGLTVLENADAAPAFDAELKTASVIEAIEAFCANTRNVWQIERSEDGVYLLLKAADHRMEGNDQTPLQSEGLTR